MTTQPNDGGPIACGMTVTEGRMTPDGGLSLRDWFAGQALIGIIANPGYGPDAGWNAPMAYKEADAMLAARKQSTESI